VSAQEQIGRVETTVQQLVGEIEKLPSEVLYREPEPGEWPVMSTLAHLAELLPYWAHEAAELAASPGKHFGRSLDDPRRVGPIEQHRRDSIEAIVPRIREGLAECVQTLRAIRPEDWQVVGQHATRGPMSVEQVVESFVCKHASEHASQIQETLKAIQSSQVP
jgi:DinB family protein